MAARRATLLLASFLLAVPAARADVRVIDDAGRILTVGNWTTVTDHLGTSTRMSSERTLGWDLHDGGVLVATGLVPGTEDVEADTMPALSRNPITGEIWLAWSRDGQSAQRDVMVLRMVDHAWVPASLRRVSVEAALNVDPHLLHDARGQGYLAWRTATLPQSLEIAWLDQDAGVLHQQTLSEPDDWEVGPPRLGLDASGAVIAAFFVLDPAAGQPALRVLQAPEIGSGILHLPNPVTELGLRADLPAPDVRAGGSWPALAIGTMSGATVVWWTQQDAGVPVFRYVHGVTGGSWAGATSMRIPMRSTTGEALAEALEMAQAQLRRFAQPAPDPTPPVPQRPLLPPLRRQ